MVNIDGVLQCAVEGIDRAERGQCGPAKDASTTFGNQNWHGRAMLLVPSLAFSIGTRGCGPHARRVSHVVVVDRVDLRQVGGESGAEDEIGCHN